jgi:hypothetical protein
MTSVAEHICRTLSAPTGEVGASPASARLTRPNMAKQKESTLKLDRVVRKRRDSGAAQGLFDLGPDGRAVERRPTLEGACSIRTTIL